MPDPIDPELFGDFLLIQRLPASGMADVFVAVRLGDRSGRTFVVKRPRVGERRTGEAAQALAREGEVLAAVRGAGIVAIEAAGEIAGLPYVAVEHVRGASLAELLAHGRALGVETATAVARDLAAALAHLHDAGWIHGDVAPANVLLDAAGEAYLIDFGVATRIGAKRDTIAGKPGYVAPEAVRSIAAHGAADVYGWGVVVAEALLGRRLFDEGQLAEAAARGDASISAATLGTLGPLVVAALRRDPAARPSARALVEQLAAMPIDRAELSKLATSLPRQPRNVRDAARADVGPTVSDSEPSGALTPTAPMLVRATLPDARPAAAQAPQKPHASSSAVNALIIGAVILAAFAAGVIVMRSTQRARPAAIALVGAMPRRVRLEIDGRPFSPSADGSEQPIAAGKHVIAVVFPRGDRKEATFTAHAGEHVVLMPIVRALANGEELPQ